MTLRRSLKCAAIFGIWLLAAQVSAEETQALKTQEDRVSYAIGVDMGRNFNRQAIKADPAIVAKGIKDAMTGDKFLMTDEEILATLNSFASELRAKQGKAKLIAAQDNKKAGEAFLTENKAREGVVTLPSNLQYRILKAGDGRKPTEADTVECSYRGMLIDGTEFDNSDRTGQPAIFKVSDNNLIPGLREALKLMPAGSKWQLFIPHSLAYGQRGWGNIIGPNATLIFELELLAIK